MIAMLPVFVGANHANEEALIGGIIGNSSSSESGEDENYFVGFQAGSVIQEVSEYAICTWGSDTYVKGRIHNFQQY